MCSSPNYEQAWPGWSISASFCIGNRPLLQPHSALDKTPETTIATEMFDGVIKDQFSTLTVDQGTMAELKNLVVDDTENLVNNDLLTLPSMSTTNKTQVDAAAGGIAENNGNAEKAFQKLRLENLGQSAITENDANKAAKYINEIILNGAGTGYLIPREITEAFAQAFLNGTSKTVAEVITAVDEAVTGTALNSSNIITSFGTRLQEIKTQYDGLTVGLSDEALTQPEYLVFDAANPLVITASATLDVGQQIALKNFIAANFLSPGQAIDNTTFASNLGYLSATGVSTSTPFFEDVNLYYGSYGGWKVGGTTQIFTPAGSTVESVTLLSASGTTVVTLSADGTNVYRLSNSDGPVVTAGTNRFTLAALLTDTSTITTPVTVEMVGIPEPSVTLIDGTAIANPGDPIQYYQLTNVGERKPVFCWSTTEVGSVAIPAGYSWAYTTEITVYGATSGATTLEVDPDTGRLSLSDTERATMEYSSLSDLGALYTNNSFISPITFLSELNSQPVAYRFYLQRILLNDQGKFNGIAAGNFTFMRYAP